MWASSRLAAGRFRRGLPSRSPPRVHAAAESGLRLCHQGRHDLDPMGDDHGEAPFVGAEGRVAAGQLICYRTSHGNRCIVIPFAMQEIHAGRGGVFKPEFPRTSFAWQGAVGQSPGTLTKRCGHGSCPQVADTWHEERLPVGFRPAAREAPRSLAGLGFIAKVTSHEPHRGMSSRGRRLGNRARADQERVREAVADAAWFPR